MSNFKISGGHKNIRLKNYDYRDGWFFVTNKTDFGKQYLRGEVYELVKRQLENIDRISEGVKLDYGTIVPSHLHVILIFKNSVFPLSEVWRRFKAKTTLAVKRQNFFKGKTLWQRNYFEHVIRNEIALEKIRTYIKNNPLKENLPLNEIYGK